MKEAAASFFIGINRENFLYQAAVCQPGFGCVAHVYVPVFNRQISKRKQKLVQLRINRVVDDLFILPANLFDGIGPDHGFIPVKHEFPGAISGQPAFFLHL